MGTKSKGGKAILRPASGGMGYVPIFAVTVFLLSIFIFNPLLGSNQAEAAVRTSAQSGTWATGSTWVGGVAPVAGDDAVIAAGHTVTLGAAASITNITINSTGILAGSTFLLTITGNYTNNGTHSGSGGATLSGASKTMDGTGLVTNTGTFTISGTKTIAASANLTFSGAITCTAAVTNSGTISVAGIFTATGVTFTNNGSVTLSRTGTGSLAGTGGFTQGANSTLNYAGSTITITTFTPTGAGNTVNYNYAGAQTVSNAASYQNLTLSGSGAKTLQTGTTTISGNLTLSGTATATTVVGLTISGNLSVGDGTTFTVGAYNISVTGATTVGGGTSGILAHSSSTGTKTYTGAVTINASGSWTNAGNAAITFGGGLTNGGTFAWGTAAQTFTSGGITNSSSGWNAGSGAITFTTNNQSISSSFGIWIYTLTVTGVTVTNNSTGSGYISVYDITGTGTFTQGANSKLNLWRSAPSVTTFDASTVGNTVGYLYDNAQTVRAITYHHLTFNNGTGVNSGQRDMTSVTTINGNLTISGRTLMINNAAFTVGGTLTYSSTDPGTTTLYPGRNISIGKFNQTSGTFVDNGNTITVTGTGASVWTRSGGTFTTAGTTMFTGAAPQIGASNFNNLTINVGTSNTATLTGAANVAGNLTLSSGTLNLGSSLTHSVNGNVTLTAGTLDGGSSTMNVTGNFGGSGGSFAGNTGTINLTSTFAGQSVGSGTGTWTFNNLTINKGGQIATLASAITINGNLTVAAGKFDTSANNYSVTFNNNGSFTGVGTYRMWYSGTNAANYQIGYATSGDGITNWTKDGANPVLIPGTNGAWDDTDVRNPWVIRESDGTYKMWYDGYDGANWKIGYATSNDGVAWTKYVSNPVLSIGTTGAWDGNSVNTPSVIRESDGTYKMWYTGYNGTTYKIGYATSNDGITWTKSGSNPVLSTGLSGAFDSNTLIRPSVAKDSGTYKMWYSGSNGTVFQIGYATSSDGTSWTKYASNPVLSTGLGGSWDGSNVRHSEVIKDSDGTYKMWYSGSDGANWKIGYATSSDGISWTKYASNPVLSGTGGAWDSTQVFTPSVINGGTVNWRSSPIIIQGAPTANVNMAGFSTGGSITFTRTGSYTTAFTGNIAAASLAVNGAGTLDLGTGAHTITGSGDTTVTISSGTLKIAASTLTLTSGGVTLGGGTLDGGSGTLNLTGNFTGAGTFTAGTGTVNYNGTSGYQTVGAYTYYNLTITKSSWTATLNGAVTATNLTITSGILDVSSNNYPVTVKGDWANTGAFYARGGTVTFNGSGAQTINSSNTWYGLTVDNSGASGGRTVSFQSGKTQTIAAGGFLTLTGASGNILNLAPATAGSAWYLNVDPTATQYICYVSISYCNALGGAALEAGNSAGSGACSVANTNGGNNNNLIFTDAQVIVGASGSQKDHLYAPSDNSYVGGVFTFVRSNNTANVTQIKVTKSGTVADGNLANVKLLYKQQSSCSVSIPADAAAFNSSGVGFSSGAATINGSMSVGTGQICVYVQLNVSSGAAAGQTFDIQIANPSTDVTVSKGVAVPATAVDIPGTTKIATLITLPSLSLTGACSKDCTTSCVTNSDCSGVCNYSKCSNNNARACMVDEDCHLGTCDTAVCPASGDTTKTYTFTVVYTGPAYDDAPATGYPKVYIGDNDGYYSYTMIPDKAVGAKCCSLNSSRTCTVDADCEIYGTCVVNYLNGEQYKYTANLGAASDIRYYYEAQASAGDPTVVRLPASGYRSGVSVHLMASGQNMVGVPKNLGAGVLYSSILADDTEYSYCRYYSSTGLFTGQYPDCSRDYIVTGKGYFIYTIALDVNTLMGNKSVDEKNSGGTDLAGNVVAAYYDINLNEGWNIISNPYNKRISLQGSSGPRCTVVRDGVESADYDSAVALGWVSNSIYEYIAGTTNYAGYAYNDDPTPAVLEPWKGYWIFVYDSSFISSMKLRVYQ